jgi:D-sedoheptulose 7-phosphate isomerase
MIESITRTIDEKILLLEKLKDCQYLQQISNAINAMVDSLKHGNKIILAGNGGSAADAQHFAGELMGRFMKERAALPAISLCVDPSVTTCIGNDYGYEKIFERQIAGIGQEGDCFIAISTSGNSENLVRAVEAAKGKQIITIGLLGKDGGILKNLCDYVLVVPSDETPRIQEIHTFTVHVMCEGIENEIFKNNLENR